MEDAYASPKKFAKFFICCPTSSVENIQRGDPSYLFSEKITISAKIFKGGTLWKYIIRQFLKSQKIKSVENIHREDPYLFSEIFAISLTSHSFIFLLKSLRDVHRSDRKYL